MSKEPTHKDFWGETRNKEDREANRIERSKVRRMFPHESKESPAKEKKEHMARKMRFHHPGTKYLPVHPIHRGEKKEE